MENKDAHEDAVESGLKKVLRLPLRIAILRGIMLIEPAIDEMRRCSGLPDWDPIAVNIQGWSEQEQESSTYDGWLRRNLTGISVDDGLQGDEHNGCDEASQPEGTRPARPRVMPWST